MDKTPEIPRPDFSTYETPEIPRLDVADEIQYIATPDILKTPSRLTAFVQNESPLVKKEEGVVSTTATRSRTYRGEYQKRTATPLPSDIEIQHIDGCNHSSFEHQVAIPKELHKKIHQYQAAMDRIKTPRFQTDVKRFAAGSKDKEVKERMRTCTSLLSNTRVIKKQLKSFIEQREQQISAASSQKDCIDIK